MNIAFIPARGGSKGIPDKNIREIGGRPLIGYTISAARESGVFDQIIVDTDSDRVADVAMGEGQDLTIYRRKEELGADDVHAYRVLKDWCCHAPAGVSQDSNIAMLLSTCPLRSSRSIRASFDSYRSGPAESPVISVYDSGKKEQHVRWVNPDGTLQGLPGTKVGNIQRDRGRSIYILNGGIYWWKVSCIKRHDTFHVEGARAFIMPIEESIDVDTIEDLDRMKEHLFGMSQTSSWLKVHKYT